MKQIWVMVGLGVTVAAGAAVLLPSRSAPPADESTIEVESTPAARVARPNPASSGGTIDPAPMVQNNFAPIDKSNVPSMKRREGPLRAPEPTKTADVRRPVIAGGAGVDNSAMKEQAAKPATVAAAQPATTTTTGSGRPGPNRPQTNQPRAGTAQENAQAQLEQRRQELENARRQRIQQGQRNQSAAMSPHQRGGPSAPTTSADAEGASSNPNGAPSIDDLIRSNPWLADYAPGGRYASGGGPLSTNGNTNGNTSGNTNGNNNSGNLGGSLGGSSGGTSGGTTGGSTNGGGGGGGTVVTGGTGGTRPTATLASFKWLPVDNRACGTTLAGFRTNDLYVRLDVAAPILGISTETNPLTIVGGSFFQASGTGDGLPTAAALGSGPCVQFDTYLNSGSAFSLIGGTTENPVFTATRANGSLFNFAGVVGVSDEDTFGDLGFYVLVGRFTAPTSITGLSGKLNVDTGIPGTTSFRSFVVDLAFDSTVWAFNASLGLPGSTSGAPLPGAFSLTLPTSGALNQSLTPVLTWSASTGATDYELTVDTDAAFAAPHTYRVTVASTSLAVPGATLTGGTAYHWRVVARNGAGTTSSTPTSASFTTLGTPPNGTPPDDTPPGGTDGGTPDPCANQAPGITAVWRPIDNMACAEPDEEIDLANFRTADLYLRMATTNSTSTIPPFNLQFVSAEVTGSPPLTLANGAFFEHSVGSNFRPSLVQAAAFPCLAFDSYVAIDTGVTETPAATAPTFQPAPQIILPPGIVAFASSGVRGLWVVPGFGASSALPAAKDAFRFPNDPCGYYIRIGRMTITSGATLTGTVLVAFVLPGSGTTTTAEVTVPNCVACWGAPAPAPPTP